ncbi:hypothetical protein [Brevibacillus sp. FIR094]|uniref:hypothetical protein n=1 Tax=Brevibacillus sp. FIR094 TaxID=3134809 RepID=UPI003D1C6BFA
MKFPSICYVCALDGFPDETIEFEFHENGVYEFTCRNNHTNTLQLLHPHFEILFELGAMALIDGYPREAVSSFATSVERFYEYCIKTYLLPEKIGLDNSNETWKLVSSQSERQLGAYYFLYLYNFAETPEALPRKWIEFRNDVIHKGKIPKYDEVYKHAEYLYHYIKKIHRQMEETLSPRSLNEEVVSISPTARGRKVRAFQSYPTVLGIPLIKNRPIDSFPTALESLKERMKNVFRK